LQDLHRVGEPDAGRDFGGLHPPGGGAAVAAFAVGGQDRNLLPWQRFEALTEVALVVFDGEDVMRPAGGDVVRGAALGVESIRCDHRTGDVHGVEKLCQHRDFVGFRTHRKLTEDRPGLLAQRGEQMCEVPGAVAGTAQGFTVQGDDPAPVEHAGLQPHPPADQGVQTAGVQALQTAADRGLTRHHTAKTQRRQLTRSGVGGPLGDAQERLGAGQRRGQRHGNDPGDGVAHPAPFPRIPHLLQALQQPGRCGRNCRQLAEYGVTVINKDGRRGR